eukprot:365966-Chlamydomonas_euryale.AAC.9
MPDQRVADLCANALNARERCGHAPRASQPHAPRMPPQPPGLAGAKQESTGIGGRDCIREPQLGRRGRFHGAHQPETRLILSCSFYNVMWRWRLLARKRGDLLRARGAPQHPGSI